MRKLLMTAAALAVLSTPAFAQGIAQSEPPEDNRPTVLVPVPVPPQVAPAPAPAPQAQPQVSPQAQPAPVPPVAVAPQQQVQLPPCTPMQVSHPGIIEVLQKSGKKTATVNYWLIVRDKGNAGFIAAMKQCNGGDNGSVRDENLPVGSVAVYVTQTISEASTFNVPTARKNVTVALMKASGPALKTLGGREFWVTSYFGDSTKVELRELPRDQLAQPQSPQ